MGDFIIQPESIASTINGETPSGEQMKLGNDVFIFSKILVFEQPVLNRLRARKEDGNLYNELDKVQGVFYLGDLEAIRAELHHNVDKMCEAILAYRKSINEKSPEAK